MHRQRNLISRLLTPYLLVVLLALAVSACGPLIDSPSHSDDDKADSSVPDIAKVTPADDVRAHQGVIDIALPDEPVESIAENPTPTLPATVKDAQGTKVTVRDTSRILALDIYGTLARTVFELGLGDSVVGRDVSSSFTEIEDRPLVTQNGHELNAEAILDLDPTVVLTDTSLGPWDVILQLREISIPVVVVDAERTLDNLASLTQEVGNALGLPDEGKRLGQRIEQQTKTVQAAIGDAVPEKLTGRLRTVFLYLRGQAGVYYMFGQGSGADTLIEAVGGYDVSKEIGWKGMRPVNDEALISAQPDVILMMRKGLESVGGMDGLLERFPALAQTPAGENERVVAMNDDQILSFGPRAPAVLNALAVALYAPDSL